MRTQSAGFLAAVFAIQLVLPAATQAETHTVKIKNFDYVPNSLTVKKGDTVRFVNEDSAPHTVTPFKDAHFKELSKLSKGESGSITFESAGKQKYYCDFHPMMEGSIVVE